MNRDVACDFDIVLLLEHKNFFRTNIVIEKLNASGIGWKVVAVKPCLDGCGQNLITMQNILELIYKMKLLNI